MIMQFTQNPAVSEPRPGGKYMMFGGMIDGEYVNIETNKKIQLKWRFKDWGEQYADVNINFDEDDDEVRTLSFLATGFLSFREFSFPMLFLEYSISLV